MDSKQLKQEVQQLVKKYSLGIIHLDGLSCKFKSAGFQSLIFMNRKKDLGWLQYSYVSNRVSEFGSMFGFSVNGGFRIDKFSEEDIPESFRLLKLLKEWNLSYKNMCTINNCYYAFNSRNTFREQFYNKGTVSIFENDDINEKIKQVVIKVNEIYVSQISRFLHGNMDLLDDIFENPRNFGYPLATALAVCKLNNREDLFNDIIEQSKNSGRMQEEIPLLNEVLSKW